MAAPGRHAWPAALAAGTTRTGSEAISEQNLAYLTALAARGLNSQPADSESAAQFDDSSLLPAPSRPYQRRYVPDMQPPYQTMTAATGLCRRIRASMERAPNRIGLDQ
jgi:hypothetical protein